MNKVYEIKYETIDKICTNYIVANNIKQLYIWLEENAKWEIIGVKCLGNVIEINSNKERIDNLEKELEQ